MGKRVVVTAPGKLILIGEHAAVYGKPAMVAAVNPRAQVGVELAERGLSVDLVDFQQRLETTWRDAAELAELARAAWQRYAKAPTPERFAEVGSGSPAGLTMTALGELAGAMGEGSMPPLAIRIESNLPIGSGFGSSASIAVALIGGVLALVGGSVDPSLVDSLALEVERRQHGLPSGVDHKTVLYGGIVLADRGEDDELHVSRIHGGAALLDRLQVFQSGQPIETTGEVVAAVGRLKSERPEQVDELLESMGRSVEAFREVLETPGGEGRDLEKLIGSYQRCLEGLGVVPREIRETIRDVEAQGGFAKISGAGSLTGPSAGCLLIYWPSGPPAELPARLRRYQRLAVELGAEGLRVEDEQ